MKKIRRHHQVIIPLAEGATTKEVLISGAFDGDIVGIGTVTLGDIPSGQSADVSMKNGSSIVMEPIDIGFTDIAGKDNQVFPVRVERPGNIRVVVTPTATIGTGEDYSVRATVFYESEC